VRNKSQRFVQVVRHFHSLLALMTGTVVAALLIPLLCRLVALRFPETEFVAHFLTGDDSSPAASMLHYLYGLSFLQGAAFCLVFCFIVNMPFAYAAYRRGCEESIPF
jgi:hypothetical protein